jgi:hypothetical protein
MVNGTFISNSSLRYLRYLVFTLYSAYPERQGTLPNFGITYLCVPIPFSLLILSVAVRFLIFNAFFGKSCEKFIIPQTRPGYLFYRFAFK